MAGVRDISNPISLARLVMERTEHVMLIGEGANVFASDMGIPRIDPKELVSPVAIKKWEEDDKYAKVVSGQFNLKCNQDKGSDDGTHCHDTVGAVAMDLEGNIAAASSTGGITRKMVGRVGDSPLIGSGACCDNSLGGVSCTGHGESIAKVVLAYRALQQLRPSSGLGGGDGGLCDMKGAFVESLGYMLERVHGQAGMIGIDRNGGVAKHFTTARMSWASVDKTGMRQSGL